jgi:hypothetical protein
MYMYKVTFLLKYYDITVGNDGFYVVYYYEQPSISDVRYELRQWLPDCFMSLLYKPTCHYVADV